MKIYTKAGDDGTTGLLFGGRVSKTDPRCVAYGEADFATSAMGFARALAEDPRIQELLLQVQREMFTLSGELATDQAKYASAEFVRLPFQCSFKSHSQTTQNEPPNFRPKLLRREAEAEEAIA